MGTAERGVSFPPGPSEAPSPANVPVREPAPTSDGGGSGFALGGLLVPLLLFGGAFLLIRRMFRRRAQAEAPSGWPMGEPEPDAGPSFEDVRALAEQDVMGLGAEIYALDPQVHADGAPREALADFREAVRHYDEAQELLQSARTPEDLNPVTSAIEQSRYALAATRARLTGEPVPERRPPCFFDPRHGPSVTDVEWAPPGGVPRPVPACAMDAERIRRGDEPETRELVVAGQRMPYWNAPARYGGWAGGYFGGFGGPALLGGLLLGGLGGLFAGELLDPDDASAADGGYGDANGDYGGGDLGGDYGGGDFGGGDYGGGDF
jgi:hypothetical protein